jgi:tetratricopeptide (TPR) repeat protein
MQRNVSFSISLTVALLILLFLEGCSSSLPKIELNKEYGFQNKKSVSIYVIPSGNAVLDKTYSRVVYLDLQARGYKVIDANRLFEKHSDELNINDHRQIADSLQSKKYLPVTDVYFIAQTAWDSAYVLTYYSEQIIRAQLFYSFKGMFVPTLTSHVAFFDRSIREPIKSYSSIDTTYIYSEDDNSQLLYPEFPWMVVAKQLSREFKDIPICSTINTSPDVNKFKISLWVDNSYREAFKETWKDRLKLRILYANDILRPQFNIELIISEFIEWDSQFQQTLDKTLEKLYHMKASDPKSLQIGITLNKKLKRNWNDRSNIGLAYLLGNDAVITAQPSFPSVGQLWNPIEEAITIAHEVGHILGAIHIPEESSIMFPTSGSLSYEFDNVNRRLIESTKATFFAEDEKVILQNYIQELIAIKDIPSLNSNPILVPMASGLIQKYFKNYQEIDEPEKIFSSLSEIIPDSIYSLAVLGYIKLKFEHYEEAKDLFIKVLELDPEFAEVNWYLSKVYSKLKDRTQADIHRQAAKPYKKLWVLDDSY